MAEIESFSWTRNQARITEGLGDGSQFKSPIPSPTLTIVDDVPASSSEKAQTSDAPSMTIIDSWNLRRSK